MAEPALREDFYRVLSGMTEEEQNRALTLVRGTAQPPHGATGSELRRIAGILDEESAREMMEAIETDCRNIDPDAW